VNQPYSLAFFPRRLHQRCTTSLIFPRASRSLQRNFTKHSHALHAGRRGVRETAAHATALGNGPTPATEDHQPPERYEMTNVKTAFSLRQILAPALLLAISATAMPAGADTLDAPLSIKVHYADLDMTHAAGIKALYGRIQNAARKVCEPLASMPGLQTGAWDKCVANAVSTAVQSVGQPALSSLYEEKTGKVLPAQLASLEVR